MTFTFVDATSTRGGALLMLVFKLVGEFLLKKFKNMQF